MWLPANAKGLQVPSLLLWAGKLWSGCVWIPIVMLPSDTSSDLSPYYSAWYWGCRLKKKSTLWNKLWIEKRSFLLTLKESLESQHGRSSEVELSTNTKRFRLPKCKFSPHNLLLNYNLEWCQSRCKFFIIPVPSGTNWSTVPLARNFPWHASDALSIRASVLKLCTRQLRVRKNLHMHVAGASIASQFLLFEVCTWGFSDNRTRIKLSKGHGKWTVQPEISQLRLRNVFV